ncbi:hypothetical protein K4K57_009207 [Colletotrichum sp. SAR 10_99]|nr:hypothetical protein K4K57_009207 [Colletotrichum sp. SAR 10_99]
MNTKTAIASEDESLHGRFSAEGVVSSEYELFCRLRESFTEEKQASLIRKVDFRILPPLVLVYLLAYIDRSNAGNAKLFGALEHLGLNGQQWNVSLAVFFITYAAGGV